MLDRNAGIRGFPKTRVGAYYCTLGNYQLPLYRITVLYRGLLSESGDLVSMSAPYRPYDSPSHSCH